MEGEGNGDDEEDLGHTTTGTYVQSLREEDCEGKKGAPIWN